MHLQSAETLLGSASPETSAEIARSMALLQEAIDEARYLIRGLHPPMLEGTDLVAAIESLVEQQRASSNEEIEFLADKVPLQLSRFQETAIFRIVQEALTNAVRHSGSKRIRIELTRQADDVCIGVRDWGRGFDPQAPRSGYGLKGIQYRARVLRGRAAIRSVPGDGTQIAVQFPSRMPYSEKDAEAV